MGKISVNFGSSGAYTIELSWTQGTQSVANNTTPLHFTCSIHANRKATFNGQARTDTLTVGGTTVRPQHGSYVVPDDGSVVVLWETDVTVTHDSDGSYKNKAISVGVLIDTTFSTSGYIGTVTASGTITLDTIPRTSTLSYTGSVLGSQTTFTINAKSTAFTHKLTYKYGTKTGTIKDGVKGGTHTWTSPISLAAEFPNANTGDVTYTMTTYTGSTVVGTKTVTGYLKIPENANTKPILKSGWAVASYYNDGTAAAGIAAFVQGYSRARVSFTGSNITFQHGAIVKSYKITCAGVTDSASPFLTGVLTGTSASIVCTVTDSRGFTASETLKVTLYPYSNPALSSLSLYRGNEDGTANTSGLCIWAKATLKYSDIGGKNSCSLQGFYRLAGGSYGTGQNLVSNQAKRLTNAAAVESSYVAKIVAKDSLGNSRQYEATIPTAAVAFHIREGGKGAAFGKYAETDSLLDVGWDLRVHGKATFDDQEMVLRSLGRGSWSGDLNELNDMAIRFINLAECQNGPSATGYGLLETLKPVVGSSIRVQRFTSLNTGSVISRIYATEQWYPWSHADVN